MKKIFIIDANSIIHRAFHALPNFSTSSGFPTNAIYGFFSMLIKALQNYQPTHIFIAFDVPKPTFRDKIFKKYRAQRPETKHELKIQIPIIKNALEKSGFQVLAKEGFEADDIIGSLVEKFSKYQKIFVLSGDKDLLQLADDNIVIILPRTGLSKIREYTKEKVKEEFGINPKQIPDLKALAGDQSDNYKGAEGIGPKTALNLLHSFPSIEYLLKNTEKIESEKLRQTIERSKENIKTAKKLAVIRKDLDLDVDIQLAELKKIKIDELKKFFKKYQMQSLLKRLDKLSFLQEKNQKNQNILKQKTLF